MSEQIKKYIYNANLEQNSKSDNRKFFRINTILKIKYLLIDNNYESLSFVRNNKLFEKNCDFPITSLEENEKYGAKVDILSILVKLDSKLNFIINALNLKGSENILPGNPTEVTISGSGLSFCSYDNFKKNDILKIDIELPIFPFSLITVTGKVVNTIRQSDGKNKISIRYINLPDFIADKIIQYTLSCQREMIRSFSDTKSNRKKK
ncbi:MAG: PilZ domain-containing protein [Candidatus Schekmanbacteria bacterium]|nr:PilZ domain-containing protein [Candidatus Schekmanbacteria bacterium]